MNHDRFDALAGAVMLGEATPSERELFAGHAATCALCQDDAAAAPQLAESIARSRDAETWRPALRDAIVARVRESRTSRFRRTVGVLGWAAALSLVINLAVVSGLSGRVAGAFNVPAAAEPAVTSLRLELESPAPRPIAVRLAPRPERVAVAPPRHRANQARRLAAAAVAAPTRVAPHIEGPSPIDADVPDVLAGLDIDGESGGTIARHVAVAPKPPCAPADAERAPAAAIPCPLTSADLPR